MTLDVESVTNEKLGFYPSYLAAVEEYPTYAKLAWDETEQVLTAPWAKTAGCQLAAAVESITAEQLPQVEDQGGPRSAVQFFAFVVFRLGFSISACRYGLEEPSTLYSHQRPLPESSAVSSLLAEGIETDLPSSPSLILVQPEDATGRVTDTYEHILTELETPNVNNVFRAFAAEPDFLDAVVETVMSLYDNLDSRRNFEKLIRGWYARVLVDTGYILPDHRQALRDCSADRLDFNEVRDRICAFHKNLPTLVATVVVASRLLAED